MASHVLVGSHPVGDAAGGGDVTQIATDDWGSDASSQSVAAPNAIIETLLPRDDAVAVLVGASLMSAYVITDAKTPGKPKRRTITRNGRGKLRKDPSSWS